MADKETIKDGKIEMRIHDLQFVSFDLSPSTKELKNPISRENLEFNFNFHTQVNKDAKLIILDLTIIITEKSNSKIKTELGILKLGVSFEILNFDDVILFKENNVVTLPHTLIATMAGIAVSSARGMLSIQVKNTVLCNAIIPIINPQIFLPATKEAGEKQP